MFGTIFNFNIPYCDEHSAYHWQSEHLCCLHVNLVNYTARIGLQLLLIINSYFLYFGH